MGTHYRSKTQLVFSRNFSNMYNRKNRLLNKIAGMALPTNRMKTEARKKKLRASYHLHVKAKFILMAINLVVV